MPARPKPGVGQGRRASIDLGGMLGGLGGALGGLGSGGGGTPGLDAISTPQGPNEGSGEGPSVTPSSSGGMNGGAMPKPSFLAMLDPTTRAAYYNYLYNVNPALAAGLQKQQIEGSQQLAQIGATGSQQLAQIGATGSEARKTNTSKTEDEMRADRNKATLAFAAKYNIAPEQVPDLQDDLYPSIKQTQEATQGTALNTAQAQKDATATPQFQQSTNVGANAEAQSPFFRNLSMGGKMEAGPGQTVKGFGDIYNQPLSLAGPMQTGSSSTHAMIGPNGQLMSKTQDTTGQSFGGSSSSQPIPPITPDEVSAAANAANPSNVQTKPSIPPTSGIGMGDLSPLLRGDTNPNNVQTKPVLAPQQSDGLGVAPVPLGLQIQKLLQMLKPSPTNNGTNQFDPY